MHEMFHLSIKDVFFLRDGRTVLTGPVAEGEMAVVVPGPANILIDGRQVATVQFEREAIASRSNPMERLQVRAVSTREQTGLTKEIVASHVCLLEGPMRYAGHRDLMGIDSPPADYIADDMTLGPRLPKDWDGDAWMKPDGAGYFLRAWNKKEARCATAHAAKYEEARQLLLDEIASGGKRVEIRMTESRGSPSS